MSRALTVRKALLSTVSLPKAAENNTENLLHLSNESDDDVKEQESQTT